MCHCKLQVPALRFSMAFDSATLLTETPAATRRLLQTYTAVQDGVGDAPQDLPTFNLWCTVAKTSVSAQYFTPCHATCPAAVAESVGAPIDRLLPPRRLILLLYNCRLYRILAAAAGLDDWTRADSPGIQQLRILPTSARSLQAEIAVVWVPPPDGVPSPYAAPPSDLLVTMHPQEDPVEGKSKIIACVHALVDSIAVGVLYALRHGHMGSEMCVLDKPWCSI